MPAVEEHQSVQADMAADASLCLLSTNKRVFPLTGLQQKTPGRFQQASVPTVTGGDFRHVYWGFELPTRHFP